MTLHDALTRPHQDLCDAPSDTFCVHEIWAIALCSFMLGCLAGGLMVGLI